MCLLLCLVGVVLLSAAPAAAQSGDEGEGDPHLGNFEQSPHTRTGDPFAGPITFTVMGDAPYGDDQIASFLQHLNDHNLYARSKFVVHVGDIFGGSEPCTEDRYERMVTWLTGLAVPTFIIPGDNEWVDCADPDEGWFFWEKHLMGLEQKFCGVPNVEHQPVRPENFVFVQSGVLFIGINLVAGAPDETMVDAAAWVRDNLQLARAAVRSAVVFSQAGPSGSRDMFFDPFLVDAAAFGKPILFIHGDGHNWEYEDPYGVPNVLRVQVPRATSPWVRVTATRDATQPFIVNKDPWSADAPLVNNVPCVDAGNDIVVNALKSAYLHGKTNDDGLPTSPLDLGWSQVSGPGSATFVGADSARASVSFSSMGTYELRLAAFDGFYTGSDIVRVVAADPATLPFAGDDLYSTDEDSVLTLGPPGVLANDSHGSGLPLSATLFQPPEHGNVALAADGSFTYTPEPNWFGVDTFLYTAHDSNNGMDTGSVTILVNPVNDLPIAVDDLYVVETGQSLNEAAPGVMTNDIEPDGEPLVATLVIGTANGALLLNPDGSFSYTPLIEFIGTDSFTYKISDGSATSQATVSISVSPVVLPGTAIGDAYVRSSNQNSNFGSRATLRVEQDNTVFNSYLKFQVSGVGPNVLRATLRLFSVNGGPDGGSAHAVSNSYQGSATPWDENGLTWSNAPAITSPALDSAGVVADDVWVDFDVTQAITGDGTYSFALQNLSNRPVEYSSKEGSVPPQLLVETDLPNDDPVATDDAYTTDEEVQLVVPQPGVLANDSDDPRDALSASLVTEPASGTLALSADGSFTYTPATNFAGVDTFTYRVSDTRGGSDTGGVSITVNPLNDDPVAGDDSYATLEDGGLSIEAPGLLGNDTDVEGDPLSASLSSGPANGTLSLAADGSFTYTPNADFHGADAFVYNVSDGNGGSDSASVSVTVVPANDAPVASDDSYAVDEDQLLSVAAPGVVGNDADVDGDALQSALDVAPLHGNVVLGTDGSFDYTPHANYNGADLFTYIVDDGTAADSASVAIVVNAVNDAPSVTGESFTIAEDSTLVVAAPGVLANDADVDGDALAASVSTDPAHGTLTLAPDGGFTYAPDADFNGSDSFTYRVADGLGGESEATVTLTLLPVNDAPAAQDDYYTVAEDGTRNEPAPGVLANDVDVDADALTVTPTSAPANGSLTLNADGSFVYTPAPDFDGLDSFTYSVSDGQGGVDNASVTLDVGAVNDPPVAANDAYSTPEDSTLSVPAPGLLSNDADADGDPLSAQVASGPAQGTLTLDPDGSFTYTPNPNFNGADAFTYMISDGKGGSDTASVDLSVSPLNDPPAAVDDDYTTNEDVQLVIFVPGVLGNDSDVEGDALSASVATPPTQGVLSLDPSGWFIYTPNAHFNGADTFTYTLSDGSATDEGLVTIIVTPVNDLPVALDDAYTTDEDVQLAVASPGVLGNDSDVDADVLLVSVDVAPVNGALILNADGSFIYTPDANFHGIDTFIYTASDGNGGSDTATVSISVDSVNDIPVALDDAYATDEDVALVVSAPGVLANDADADADLMTSVVVTPPANGTLTLNTDGSFTYTPNPDFNGTAAFTYQVSDGNGGADTGLVTLTIHPLADAPVATDDAYATDEDVQLIVTAPGVLANDNDVDGDPLQSTVASGPANGSLSLAADGSFTYTPNPDFVGADAFTYTLSDGNGGSDTGSVTLSVGPVNDAPVAVADAYATDEDTPVVVAAPGVLGNDSDLDGDALTSSMATPPQEGTLTLGSDGSFTYTPNADFNGGDSFTYTVTDGKGGSDTASVTLTVNPVNDAPAVTDDGYATDEEVQLIVAAPGVLANDFDVDGDGISAALASGPANGSLSLGADGSFTYTPNPDFAGSDSFTYTASDGNGGSSAGSVDLSVNALNDAPVATDDAYATAEDTPLVVVAPGVLANDNDVDADVLSATLASGPASGNVTLNVDGSFTYTPNANFNGADSFTYTLSDGNGGSDSGNVALTVDAVNDAPVVVADAYATTEDSPLSVAAPGVLSNDTDPEGDLLSAALDTPAANGSISLAADGGFTYTPDPDFNGVDSFSYSASDGNGGSSVQTVTIDVTGTPDSPVGANDAYATDEDVELVITAPGVLQNDADADGDALSASLLTGPANGSLTLSANGSFRYTPNPDFSGADSFSYSVSDGNGGSDSANVTLTVNSVNDPPVAVADAYATDEDVVLSVSSPGLLANDSDPEAEALSTAVVAQPANGSLLITAVGSFEYTPDANFHGVDAFTYSASDGNGGVDSATVTLTVNPVQDAPVAADDSYSTDEDTPLVVAAAGVLGNDSDVDGDALTASTLVGPANGALLLDPDGGFTYTPDSTFSGTDTFSYTADDGAGGSDTALVTITVVPGGVAA
ncbi:MAG: tandem-95 repeat protein, partial [Candidatus Latescibacterota bacterium]